MILQNWKQAFESIYNVSEVANDEAISDYAEEVNESNSQNSLNIEISRKEVCEAIKRAKMRKAAGIDNVKAEVLKNEACIDILHRICNHCFTSGQVPSAWNKSIITPIPKDHSKDPRVPLNYRGIALISIPCKIYCDILNHRVTAHLDKHNIIVDGQNGHRKKRSCADHLHSLNAIIQNRINWKQSTYVCFVDFRKAFDSVNRKSLWYKVSKAGVNGRMLSAIKSLYNDVSYSVKVNGHLTDWFKVNNGVKQGCVLSCSLFQIYLNDLAQQINQLQCGIKVDDRDISLLMFADDVALVAKNHHDLQRMLDCVAEWCQKWKLNLNADKSKIIHFRHNSKSQCTHQFKCGHLQIDYAPKYKYLGLWFHEHLDYNFGVQQLSKAASRALGSLTSKFYKVGGMDFSVYTKLYESLVLPVLLYGASVWGFKKYKCLNVVQNRAQKVFLGLGRCSPNNAAIGDMGWTSIYARQLGEFYRMMLRLYNMEGDRLNKAIFKWSRRQKKSNEAKFQKLLDNFKCSLTVSDKKAAVKNLVEKIRNFEQIEWYNELWNDKGNEENGNKLRCYRLFKCRKETEHYVSKSMPREARKAIARLRSGTLPIYVELGRYHNIPLQNRICNYCNSNAVEDEKHLLLDCELYKDIRHDMIKEMCSLKPDFMERSILSQFCILMSTTSIQCILGTTLVKMLKRRNAFTV